MKCRRVVGSVLASLAIALGACGSGDEVSDYCSYGAVSQAQLDGCKDHVDTGYIDRLDTHAAQYARGKLDECLGDAGPFCESR